MKSPGRRWVAVAVALCLAGTACVDWDTAQQTFCAQNPTCGQFHIFSGKLGGGGIEGLEAMTRTASGDTALAGFYTGASNLGGTAMPDSGGSNDLFVASYGDAGEHLWSVGIGGGGADEALGLAADGLGAVYLAGRFSSGSLTLPNSLPVMTRGGVTDGLIAKIGSNGTMAWATQLKGNSSSDVVAVRDVSVRPGTENPTVTGSFRGNVTLGATHSSGANTGLFVVKLTAAGALDSMAATGTCTSGTIQGESLRFDSVGNYFLVGSYDGTCSLAGNSLGATPTGTRGLVTLRFPDVNGSATLYSAPDARMQGAVRAVIDKQDNLIVVGSFRGTAPLVDDETVVGQNFTSSDVLVLKIDRVTGTATWGVALGGPADDQGLAVAVDDNNRIWLTGSYEGQATFGDTTLTSVGGQDVFLVRLSTDGEVEMAYGFGATGNQKGGGVSVGTPGVWLGGQFTGTLNLGGDDLTAQGTDLFLSHLDL